MMTTEEKIDEILDAVRELREWKIQHTEAHVRTDGQLQDINSVLFSNPSGVVARVSRLWAKADESIVRSQWIMSIVKALIVIAIVAVTTFMLQIWKEQNNEKERFEKPVDRVGRRFE